MRVFKEKVRLGIEYWWQCHIQRYSETQIYPQPRVNETGEEEVKSCSKVFGKIC